MSNYFLGLKTGEEEIDRKLLGLKACSVNLVIGSDTERIDDLILSTITQLVNTSQLPGVYYGLKVDEKFDAFFNREDQFFFPVADILRDQEQHFARDIRGLGLVIVDLRGAEVKIFEEFLKNFKILVEDLNCAAILLRRQCSEESQFIDSLTEIVENKIIITKPLSHLYIPAYEVNRLALSLYRKNSAISLEDDFNTFLKYKKISPKIADMNYIGIADSDNQLVKAINQFCNTKRERLLDAGIHAKLIKVVDGEYRDTLKNRIVFPVINERGNVVGFWARAIINEDGKPFYKNTVSNDNECVLYGENLLKKESESLIIVEGIFDVLAIQSKGIHNSVALLGRVMTTEKLIQIEESFSQIILGFDNDSAGMQMSYSLAKRLKNPPLLIQWTPYKDAEDSLKD